MRRVFFCLCAAFLVALCQFPAAARAGAWTDPAGQGEVIVTTFFEKASQSYDQAGRLVPTPLYVNRQASALIDYGVADWLMLIAKPTWQVANLGSPVNQHYNGLGDSEIGAQARVWAQDSTVFSVQADLRLPNFSGSSFAWLRDADHMDFEGRALLGQGFDLEGLPGFVDAQAAYRLRGGPAPNEWRGDLTLGLYVRPDIMLMLQSFNIVSAASHDPCYPHWAQSKLQASLVYQFSRAWRVQLGGFTTVAGRDAPLENGLLLALWRQF